MNCVRDFSLILITARTYSVIHCCRFLPKSSNSLKIQRMEVKLKRTAEDFRNLGPSSSKFARLASTEPGCSSKATIRVRENLTQKGPSIDPAASPSSQENEIKLLREEIRALHWLARRKEQEWDNVIRLLKQKEERLMRSERQYSLGAGDLTLYRASQSLCDLASKSLVRNSLNDKPVAEMNTQQHLSTGLSSSNNTGPSGQQFLINLLQPDQLANLLKNGPKTDSLASTNGSDDVMLTPTIVSSTSLAFNDDNDDIQIIDSSVVGRTANQILSTLQPSPMFHSTQFTTSASPKNVTLSTPKSFTQSNFKTILPSTSQSSPASNSNLSSNSASSSTFAGLPKASTFAGLPSPSNFTVLPNVVSSHVTSSLTSPNFISLLPKVPLGASTSTSYKTPTPTTSSTSSSKKAAIGPASKTGGQKPGPAKTCEFCKQKVSQFLCAGCSNRSYCSRTCQESDWDNHADFCV